MSDATEKNFQIVQNVMNEQATIIREINDRLVKIEATNARLQAEIGSAKQLMAHMMGRGTGSTVHTNGN